MKILELSLGIAGLLINGFLAFVHYKKGNKDAASGWAVAFIWTLKYLIR